MATNPQKTHYTVKEYLALERDAEIKHEYLDGEIYAMSGANRSHNRIAMDIGRILGNQLVGKPCEPFNSDMKVQVSSTRYTYPDLSVACDPIFTDDTPESLINPILIIEILSPSTEKYDRGQKAQYYREMSSLSTYLIVSQHQPHIEQFVRQDDGSWRYTEAKGTESSLHLPSIDCTLSLADVYARVEFEANEDE